MYDRKWYLENREKHIARTSAFARENRERYNAYRRSYVRRNRIFLRQYLATNPCVGRGEADPIVLEFDHLEPKEKTMCVSKVAANGSSLDTVKKEMAKCQVLCANCHKRKHKAEFWYTGEELEQ